MIGATATAAGALSWVWATPTEPLFYLTLRGMMTGVAFSGNVMFAMSIMLAIQAFRQGQSLAGAMSAMT